MGLLEYVNNDFADPDVNEYGFYSVGNTGEGYDHATGYNVYEIFQESILKGDYLTLILDTDFKDKSAEFICEIHDDQEQQYHIRQICNMANNYNLAISISVEDGSDEIQLVDFNIFHQ